MRSFMHVYEEVAEALTEKKPVVALESTIIAHGMPFPQNLETARMLGATIRDQGAIPATIALLDGKIQVGLGADQLQRIATEEVAKTSIRDIPFVLTQKLLGATTVAATMQLAHYAGIRVFATGGIGGMHRGWKDTFDVSADLIALSEIPMAVVASGAKSILDLPATIEFLETFSVPVVALGVKEIPAFFSRESGIPAPITMDNPKEIAEMLHCMWDLDLPQGVLIANPCPKESEIPAHEMEVLIKEALQAIHPVQGKESTPLLLQKLVELSGGRTLRTNIALAKSNALHAAEIAGCIHTIKSL